MVFHGVQQPVHHFPQMIKKIILLNLLIAAPMESTPAKQHLVQPEPMVLLVKIQDHLLEVLLNQKHQPVVVCAVVLVILVVIVKLQLLLVQRELTTLLV